MIYLKSLEDIAYQIGEFKAEEIGQKAVGLLSLPKQWTPPFFILTTDFFDTWDKKKSENAFVYEELKPTLNVINQELQKLKKEGFNKVIVRSSATTESLEDRGYFESKECNNDLKNVIETIEKVCLCANELIKNNETNRIAIIIQGYLQIKYSGHLSSERRVARNLNVWNVEYINHISNASDSEMIRISTKDNILANSKIRAGSKNEVIEKLKIVAFKSYLKKERCHFEWIWDGSYLWFVQKDIEISIKGKKPGSNWLYEDLKIDIAKLKILKVDEECENQWEKINTIKIFRNLNLPTSNIFVLEDMNVMQILLEGEESVELQDDLKIISQYPIVIRTSLKKENSDHAKLYLPRTDTVFNWNSAEDFIKNTIKKLTVEEGLGLEDFAFLIHHFIVSKSCALVYTRPDSQKVRIDSTWGLADGLAYNGYDSFEVDIKNEKIKKKIRGKHEYLDIDNKGNWIIQKSGSNWDWKSSLDNDEVVKISEMSSTISKFLNKPLIIMFFINYKNSKIHSHILPWYLIYDIPSFYENLPEKVFNRKIVSISNHEDLEFLKKRIKKEYYKTEKITLRLKFEPSILRDSQFIKEIGALAKVNDYHVELEGSILSHAFYLLSNQGVKLKCYNLFEPKYGKQAFHKLVRDKIPLKISQHGENSVVTRIPRKALLELLKNKAVEEALELKSAIQNENVLEELADIYEVIRGISNISNISIENIKALADKKREERGGFEEGIYLRETMEQSITTLNYPKSEYKNTSNARSLKGEKVRIENNNLFISLVPSVIRGETIAINLKEANKFLVIKYLEKEVVITLEDETKHMNPNQLKLF